jgi:hypothetical protein
MMTLAWNTYSVNGMVSCIFDMLLKKILSLFVASKAPDWNPTSDNKIPLSAPISWTILERAITFSFGTLACRYEYDGDCGTQ